MSQSVSGLVSRCPRGDSRYKTTHIELPVGFSYDSLISSHPPDAQTVLDAVAMICYDCGQKKAGEAEIAAHSNYCNECYVEEKVQSPPLWLAMVHRR